MIVNAIKHKKAMAKAKAAQNSGTDTVHEVKKENLEEANDNTDIDDKEEK